MAEIVSLLLQSPPDRRFSNEEYNKRIKSFISSLNQLPSTKLATSVGDQDLLDILDPYNNSLSYLCVLRTRLEVHSSTKSKSTLATDIALLRKAFDFLNNFDGAQIRYAGTDLRETVRHVRNQAADADLVPQAITAIRAAILNLDPSGGTLTLNHLIFLDICLCAHSFREALPILEKVIHTFPTNNGTTNSFDGPYHCSPNSDSINFRSESSNPTDTLHTADVHEYFLAGALIYLGLEQWEQAMVYLECVLTSPTQGTPSGLQVEAYQKWVIVNCLVHGCVRDPKFVQAPTLRALKSCSKPYDSLASLFQRGDLKRLQAEIGAGSHLWFEDANLGLVQQLTRYLPRYFVLGLQKTYSAVPLSLVAEWLHQPLDAARSFIEEMIATNALNTRMELCGGSAQDAVLRFLSNQSGGSLVKSETEQHFQLREQTRRTCAMLEYVQMADWRLTLTKEYVDNVRRKLRNKEEEAATGDVMSLDAPEWGGYQDEDLMLDG